MQPFSETFRSWRRSLKVRLPYVRRREHLVLQQKYTELIGALDGQATPATQARLHIAKAPGSTLSHDLCLFVTFATQPALKPHVCHHLEQLLANGIDVVLIVNTDLLAASVTIPAGLLARLSGVLIRENTGFDFGAWAHGLAFAGKLQCCNRLFLINDSIVGPLDISRPSGSDDFERLLERVRCSSADVIGLTESLAPIRHLQSYFLVFNKAALGNVHVQKLFARMLNLSTKAMVIDVYETRITAMLHGAGLRCEALFPSISTDTRSSDDTSLRWAELIRRGFPFIKMRVLNDLPAAQRERLLANLPVTK